MVPKGDGIRPLVERLEAEVNNGGFNQYFFNSAGDDALAAISALEAIGAGRTATIVRAACARFAGATPPVERDERQAALEITDSDGEQFRPEDEAFLRYDDDLAALLRAFDGTEGRQSDSAAVSAPVVSQVPTRPDLERVLIDEPLMAIGRRAGSVMAGSLIPAVGASGLRSSAAEFALITLNQDPDRTVAIHVVDAGNIGNWYSFRRSSAAQATGLSDLLPVLDHYDGMEVVVAVIRGAGTTVAVFLDGGRTRLLGAIVVAAP